MPDPLHIVMTRVLHVVISNNFAYLSFIMQVKRLLENLDKKYTLKLCLNVDNILIYEDSTYTDIIR